LLLLHSEIPPESACFLLRLLPLIVAMKISKQQVLSQEEVAWGKAGFTSLLRMWVCCSWRWRRGWDVVGNGGGEGEGWGWWWWWED
jgi:hypothetical protein